MVRLRDREGRIAAEDYHFPTRLDLPMQAEASLNVGVARLRDGAVELTLETSTFLQAVAIESPGYRPDDNHFHLAPGAQKRIVFRSIGDPAPSFSARLEPLNAPATSVREGERRRAA